MVLPKDLNLTPSLRLCYSTVIQHRCFLISTYFKSPVFRTCYNSLDLKWERLITLVTSFLFLIEQLFWGQAWNLLSIPGGADPWLPVYSSVGGGEASPPTWPWLWQLVTLWQARLTRNVTVQTLTRLTSERRIAVPVNSLHRRTLFRAPENNPRTPSLCLFIYFLL